jgi:hypothetical protein
MSCIPLTPFEMMSLKVGDKVISSLEHTKKGINRHYYEIIAVHLNNKVAAKRLVCDNTIVQGYCAFSPACTNDGELLDKWFRME